MKIHVPNSAFLGNINTFLRSLDTADSNTLEITSNPNWISVHPVVIAMIAALGLTVDKKNIKCVHMEAKSKHYLKRMGLFDLLEIDSEMEIVEHEPAGRFIPLKQVNNKNNLSQFITEIVPLLHLDPKQADPIRYIFSELIRNVFEHAQSGIGAVLCAQYYKKTNRIGIGIVDRGMGIKHTISTSHTVNTDSEAIRLALTPGITGTTRQIGGTEFNAGAGLFFIKSIAQVNREFFAVYSGNSMYKLLKTPVENDVRLHSDPLKDKHSLTEDFPYWQGTAVGVDINLDMNEDFSNLLELIKDTISKSLKERKKAIFRKAKFI